MRAGVDRPRSLAVFIGGKLRHLNGFRSISARPRRWERWRITDPDTAARPALRVSRMPPVQLQRLLQDAIVHHRAGRLTEAAALYTRIRSVLPRNFDAVHLSGPSPPR